LILIHKITTKRNCKVERLKIKTNHEEQIKKLKSKRLKNYHEEHEEHEEKTMKNTKG